MLLPARLEVQGTNPVSAVTLSLLEPEEQAKSPVSRPHSHLCPTFLQPSLPLQTPFVVPSTPPDPFLLAGCSL